MWLTLAIVLVATAASAQRVGFRHLDLGDGVSVDDVCQPSRPRPCAGWQPVGFVFGDATPWLLQADTFGRVRATGAILATASIRPAITYPSAAPMRAHRVLRTTDGGLHWREVPWPWTQTPRLFAFDRLRLDGVATGESGYVWTTDDGGAHWVDHGGDAVTWAAAAIADREIVLADASGHVVRSRDGLARETVVDDRSATIEQRDTEIVVHASDADYVVRHGSPTRRTAR